MKDQQDPDGFFFPQIVSVADNSGEVTARTLERPFMGSTVETGRTVHPGDRVLFQCRGSDPHGRALLWWLHPYNDERQAAVAGDQVQLSWTVQPSAIGQRIYVGVGMAADSHYHREGGPDEQGYDGWTVFHYRVTPAPSRRRQPPPAGRLRLTLR